MWRGWAQHLADKLPTLHEWLSRSDHAEVWFCGAGTSAFVGEVLAAYLNSKNPTARFCAVPTTDIVANPHYFLGRRGKLLVVSFGRSGDSSESVGTLDALDVLAPHVDRLHITCNASGALARRGVPGPGELCTLVLPAQTDDVGFAMTSSFTTMLLTALACFDTAPPMPLLQLLAQLADEAERILDAVQAQANSAAASMPERMVFLGSGPLLGVSRESALKVLELTAGMVATQWDSSLGFRHGPKAFVNAKTRVHVLVASDPVAQRYDLDVAREIGQQFGADAVCTIGPASAECDVAIPRVGNDGWSTVLYVLFAQYMAVHWSQRLGLNVDNPFSNGNLTRVVSGVTLYPVQALQS